MSRAAGRRFFATPARFRAWLEKNHGTSVELWVGFHKRASGEPSITWPESVDQALCYGWIDGVRKRVDEGSYEIRFTPRKAKSVWSAVNVRRATALIEQGSMRPAGLKAFKARATTGVYSYEQRRAATLSPAQERAFRADRPAWDFFQSRPPWVRRASIHWVTSAKKEETRQKRFAQLVADSGSGKIIAPLARPQ